WVFRACLRANRRPGPSSCLGMLCRGCFCFAAFSGPLPPFSLPCRSVLALESTNSQGPASRSGCGQDSFCQESLRFSDRRRPRKTTRIRRKPKKRGAESSELGAWSEEATAGSGKRGAWSVEHRARIENFQLVLKLGAGRSELAGTEFTEGNNTACWEAAG